MSYPVETDQKPPRVFVRVKVPAAFFATVEITGEDGKSGILRRVRNKLREILDAEHGLDVTKKDNPLRARLAFPMEPETSIDGEPILTLKGVAIIDTFTGE